ncbi:MAG: 3-hydroxyacyl-CoA dehydrogenase family protein, partial [Bacteriovoracia bacterium]
MSFSLSSVVVVGAGTMGAGIAQWFAQQRVPVTLTDANPAQLEKAHAAIRSSWAALVDKKKLTAEHVSEIEALLKTASMDQLPESTDLVVEAIYENKDAKLDLFRRLDAHFPAESVFASNTSSFPITELAQSVTPARRERFVGLHFFNPATLMKLVEVISTGPRQAELVRDLYDWFQARGKEPALCADTPGFIVNRVARSFYGEALRIV